jgi:LytS/YehU family sensor histidine kinase
MEIEPGTLRCEVPAFLLNPLVENAVKHGSGGPDGFPLMVRVETRLVQPDRLRLVVENTGEWKRRRKHASAAGEGDGDASGGVGLANVRARLAAIYPGDHRVGVEHGCGHVRIWVDLPARFRAVEAS